MSRISTCRFCQSPKFKNLRLGVTKVRENLELMLKESVGELTSELAGAEKASFNPKSLPRITVGTSYALYRNIKADVIAFLDFDQELLAPHFRASERALGMLARASAMLGQRAPEKCLLIQTRLSDHPVIKSALKADPGILSAYDLKLRKELGLPPLKILAEIGRTGADDFMASLKKLKSNLEISATADGRWLVRADTWEELSRTLNKIPRPPKKDIRIAVNPYIL